MRIFEAEVGRRALLAGIAALPLAGCVRGLAGGAGSGLSVATFNIWHDAGGQWPRRLELLGRLGLEPWDIARTADAKKLEVTLPAKDAGQRAAWIALMADHPRLIQRPILTAGDGTTVVGRDPDSLARVIDAD